MNITGLVLVLIFLTTLQHVVYAKDVPQDQEKVVFVKNVLKSYQDHRKQHCGSLNEFYTPFHREMLSRPKPHILVAIPVLSGKKLVYCIAF